MTTRPFALWVRPYVACIPETCALIGIAFLTHTALMANVRWALTPHVGALGFLYGLRFAYLETGYAALNAPLIITADCMGAKLFVSAFLVLTIGFPRGGGLAKRLLRYAGDFVTSMVCAFFMTILRIAMSLPFLYRDDATLIHNVLSLFVYFGSLLILYSYRVLRERKWNACKA